MIKVENVTKSFDDNEIVSNLSFEVVTGTVVSLMGASGNGKSTLLKILTGQIEDFEGSVNVLGKDIRTEKSDIYGKVGIAMDELGVYENFTARGNLLFFAKLHKVPSKEVDRLLQLFNLAKDKNKKVKKFSKGMKQRLYLALAMLKNPQLLILDEPHTGLDEKNRNQLNNLLLEYKRKGCTVLLTSHSWEDSQAISDRIYDMKNGKLTEMEVA